MTSSLSVNASTLTARPEPAVDGAVSELSLLDQALAFAEEKKITLPVFSDVAIKVQKATKEETYDISQIEKAIESDPALVAEVLRAANSAFFGGLSEVASIKAAILRLGLQRVANLVLLATEKSRYTATSPGIVEMMKTLWTHASACAMAAEWIARKVRYPHLGETVFIGALVHDIGKLFLLRVLDQMTAENRDSTVSPELIAEVIGKAHPEVGHRLLESWNLPELYRVIARDHHMDAPDPTSVALQIVRLANHACTKAGASMHPDPSMVLGAMPEASLLGLSDVAIAELEILLEDLIERAD
ncbi:MAG: HDOD domain-containing protein [Acidobacteria bacterium]|nr:HDOD domain-containing protein [Acidobacteriota bacterium]